MVCDCGNIMDRDLNAAMNLMNKAASSAVSVCGEESSDVVQHGDVKLASVKQEIVGLRSDVQTL
jgi:transposase